MRARRNRHRDRDLRHDQVRDALTLLEGWTGNGREISRTLPLNDAQHAALTERIKVAADTLQLRPHIRRIDGHTQIRLDAADGVALTEGEVALAARIEDAYRTIVGPA